MEALLSFACPLNLSCHPEGKKATLFDTAILVFIRNLSTATYVTCLRCYANSGPTEECKIKFTEKPTFNKALPSVP